LTALSIVIVNYNTREPLRRCLRSIAAERGDLPVQVIVVDNASRDGSAEMVHAEMPEALVIEPGRNTWFTGGNNLGVAAATGEYTLILNPDTLIQPGMLTTLVGYLRDNPRVGAVCPRMHFPDGRRQSICSRAPEYVDLLLGYTLLGALLAPWRDRRRAHMWYAGWERDSTRPVDVIPDSCSMSPTTLLRQVGVFDEAFRLYFTEDDLCRRIAAAGYEVHFVAEALVLHEEHASVSQVQRLASQVYFDDLIVYCRKYFGGGRAALLRALVAPTRRAMDLKQRLRGEQKAL
jgi:GT2 family glycosyltransferase